MSGVLRRLLDPKRQLHALPHRCLRGPLGTITHVATASPLVALTFDDGPHPLWTPRLLELLGAHGAHATFFMLGSSAARYPDVVDAVARAGHAIGNHSWDHPSFPLISSRDRRAQITRCAAVLGSRGARLLRPPFGQQSAAARIDAFLLGYRVVTWSVVAWDWLDRGAAQMTSDLLSQIQAGSIVLLHDAIAYGGISEGSHEDRADMLTAVSNVLTALATTMRFVTVPELLHRGVAQRRPWLVEPSAVFRERLAQRYRPVAGGE